MKTYAINEIFYSIQGEGARVGMPSVFVRFAGCNLACRKETEGFDCDTEFVSSRRMTAKQVLAEAMRPYPGANSGCPSVIFTGGEPLLQLDSPLVDAFRKCGFYVAVETNGTVDPSGLNIDWLSCSPKAAEHALKVKTANEIRYVRGAGQGIPKPTIYASNQFLSPAADGDQIDPRALATCIELVKQNPDWRLSVQQHKLWGVR